MIGSRLSDISLCRSREVGREAVKLGPISLPSRSMRRKSGLARHWHRQKAGSPGTRRLYRLSGSRVVRMLAFEAPEHPLRTIRRPTCDGTMGQVSVRHDVAGWQGFGLSRRWNGPNMLRRL